MGAGEGSRGGKVVGHSKSGRPIYAAEATAKAAMGMDPHPGVRQATAHAPFHTAQVQKLEKGGATGYGRTMPREPTQLERAGAHAEAPHVTNITKIKERTVSEDRGPRSGGAGPVHAAKVVDFTSAASKAGNASYDARGGGAAAHLAAANAHTAAASAARGTIYAAQAGVHTAAAKAHEEAAKQAGPTGTAWLDRSGTVPGAGGMSTKDSPAHLRDPGHGSPADRQSARAYEATKTADAAGGAAGTRQGYAKANEQAAVAHMQARNAHRAAGNFDKADEHDRMAKQHEDKSDRAARMDREDKAPLRGNLDRPAVLNKPGYKPR